jgi:hypothetical protein
LSQTSVGSWRAERQDDAALLRLGGDWLFGRAVPAVTAASMFARGNNTQAAGATPTIAISIVLCP